MSDITFLRIALLIFAVIALLDIIKAEWVVTISARWIEWTYKQMGFKVKLEITPKAIKVCRIWNSIMLIVILFTLSTLK